jgi:hypothetical protein
VTEKERSPMESAALAVYYHAAQLIKEGRSRDEIIRQLMKQGLSYDTAMTVLDKLATSQVNVARRSGKRNIMTGSTIVFFAMLSLLGIGVKQITGIALIPVLIILLAGLYVLGRGILQWGSPYKNVSR